MTAPAQDGPGFFGKLPGLGDFISRGLPREPFITPWDRWLQQSIASSREQLGDGWLNTYLTSPVWRFALSAGICGTSGWAGVLMPSVDKVGRYFPLTIAVPLAAGGDPAQVAALGGEWYDRAETTVLTALDEPFEVAAFEQQVTALGQPDGGTPGTPAGTHGLCFGLGEEADPGAALPTLSGQLLQSLWADHSLWWCSGSEQVAPSLLVCPSLPPPASFAALLDGSWSERGWQAPAASPAEASG